MGALTLKPLSFKVRSWELSYTNYPNFFDNNFGLVTIQKRGNEIIRILPSRHDAYFWITNQTRFYFEKLKVQRLVFPFIKEKTNFIKVKWNKIIFFLQYLKMIQNISHLIIPFSTFYKTYRIGNLNFLNNTYPALDFLSNFLFKNLFNLNNTVSSVKTRNPYIGNLAFNFINSTDFTKNKINIFNNINIVLEFPRIWSILKHNTINYYVGLKKNLNIFLLQIANGLTLNKTILLLLKEKIQVYTQEKLNINLKQIIFKNNNNCEGYSSLWFEQNGNYGSLNKDSLFLSFNTKNTLVTKKGIHFNFQSYGLLTYAKYSIYLPTSTLLEEKKVLLDGYGNLQSLNMLITRKLNVRSLVQFSFIFNLIFSGFNKHCYRYIKQTRDIKQIIKKKKTKPQFKNLQLLETIILLFFGRLEENLLKTSDFSQILLTKNTKFTKRITNKSQFLVNTNLVTNSQNSNYLLY